MLTTRYIDPRTLHFAFRYYNINFYSFSKLCCCMVRNSSITVFTNMLVAPHEILDAFIIANYYVLKMNGVITLYPPRTKKNDVLCFFWNFWVLRRISTLKSISVCFEASMSSYYLCQEKSWPLQISDSFTAFKKTICVPSLHHCIPYPLPTAYISLSFRLAK